MPAPATLDRGDMLEVSSTDHFVITADEPVLVVQLLASSFEIVDPPAGSTCSVDPDCAPGFTCDLFGGCQSPTCTGAGGTCPPGHVCSCPDFFQCSCEPIGDPTLIPTTAIGQMTTDHAFITPPGWLEHHITIVAPTGATVSVDGGTVGPFNTVGASGYGVLRMELGAGVHTVTASSPVGVTVYGYSDDASYGYAAGVQPQ